ncbi:MAG: hypothetical protein PHV82_06075 [Victivallaceae bacterium]|nr:hypothetical protein [Victivallaceae bacterium]
MNVKALKLFDYDYGNQWENKVSDHWDYTDFKNNESWRKGWISMDCALYNPNDDRVYLGITSFDADIFRAYDRKKREFVDLGYGSIANKFDAKFHRSLVESNDNCLYAAIALLHDSDNYLKAPGSPIVKYDLSSGTISKMGIPVPHAYIQSIAIDNERDMIYGQCLAPEYAFSFNLKTRESRIIGLLGSGYGGLAQGENIVVDRNGCAWFTWSVTRAWQDQPGPDAHRLCKYDPEKGEMIFFAGGLPKKNGDYGFAKPEAFFVFNDEYVYASGDNGSFYRIDADSGQAELLFTPVNGIRSRLSSLVKTADGIAYGISGRDGKCRLLKVNYSDGSFELLGEIKDSAGAAMWQCHDIVHAGNNVFYACENDNPYRSSYLWEISL